MIHTKFRGNRPAGSGEDFLRVFFTIYGCGGHLGHVTSDQDVANKLSFLLPKDAPYKIWL